MSISLLICTYNRAALLTHCLAALVAQTEDWQQDEIIVIDNNCRDHTAQVVQDFADQLPVRRVLETQQGLSYARNRGYREARGAWVVYLDDDARAAPDFLARTRWLIDRTDYRIFGGVFLPWYHYGRPRWYQDAYASNKLAYTQLTTLRGDNYASGGILAIERALLEAYGGFHTGIGMSGTQAGYAEETELQARMRAAGVAIGYDPAWIIYHVVAPYKLSVDWFFRSAFALGRDKVKGGMTAYGPGQLLLIALTAIGLTTVDALRNGWHWATRSDYYVENWLIDTFRKTAKRVGMIYTALLLRYGSESDDAASSEASTSTTD